MGMFEHFPYTNFHDLNLDWLLKTMKSIKDSLDDLWKQFLESRVPRGGDPNQVLTKTTADDFAMAWKDAPHELPEGGTQGQMLSKKSDSNYDVQWSDAPESLPEGGAQGQVLAKKSAENFDVEWVDQSGGGGGDYLPLAGGTMVDGAVIGGSFTIGSSTDTVDVDATARFTGRTEVVQPPTAADDATNKGYVDGVAVPAGGTTGQVLAKKSDTDRDCEWVDQSGGASGDYLPLAGGTMNADATINFTESGSGHSELSSGELHHTGNPFQFVGDFNFQTHCPSTQGTPQTANDLTPKGYVDGIAIPAGGTTGQVLAKKSDTDRDCEWVNQSGVEDFVKKTGDTMTGTLKIAIPNNEEVDAVELHTPLAPYKQTLRDDTIKIQSVDVEGGPIYTATDIGPGTLLLKSTLSDGVTLGSVILTRSGLLFKSINGASGVDWQLLTYYKGINDYGVYFTGTTLYEGTPKQDNEIVNKKYVDNAIAGGGSSAAAKSLTISLPYMVAETGEHTYSDFATKLAARFGISSGMLRLTLQPNPDGNAIAIPAIIQWPVSDALHVILWGFDQDEGTPTRIGRLDFNTTGSLIVSNVSAAAWQANQTKLIVELLDNQMYS